MDKKALVTGSCGLIGSECVRLLSDEGFEVTGVDNNMRAFFFGEQASNAAIKQGLIENVCRYHHHDVDIRDKDALNALFKTTTFDLIIHAAAQPSHDWAASHPYVDFDINASGTLNLLENMRIFSPEAVFIFASTNKVYGDGPNALPFVELATRWELPSGHEFYTGISETMSLDRCLHSLFGVSKASADLLVQEYGRYFGLKTAVFRLGCVSGPAHKGVALHGFLSYLVACCSQARPYTIYGYKGKQVRDTLHARDVASAFYEAYRNPRPYQVYNLGGTRALSVSVQEAIALTERVCGKKLSCEYSHTNRKGDHIWWISDISRFKSDYPNWQSTFTIEQIIEEIFCAQCNSKKASVSGRAGEEI